MNYDQDEIAAEANRLRQSDWMRTDKNLTDQELEQKKLRTQHIPKTPGLSFGKISGGEREAATWLAQNIDDAGRPLRPFLVDTFGLSFDEAGRAVSEAERLLGRPL